MKKKNLKFSYFYRLVYFYLFIYEMNIDNNINEKTKCESNVMFICGMYFKIKNKKKFLFCLHSNYK